jgi:hypothetical protein
MHLLVRPSSNMVVIISLTKSLVEYMELSGNMQHSALQFYSPEHIDSSPGKRIAWMTSRGLFHATLLTTRQAAVDVSSQDFLDVSSLLPYPAARSDGTNNSASNDSFPLGVVLTEFHFLLLLNDRVMGYSRLDQSLVYDEIISLVRKLFLRFHVSLILFLAPR